MRDGRAGGQGGGRRGVVGHGVVEGGIAEQGEVGKGLQGEPVGGTALIKAGGGEVAGGQAVADEKDDRERFLHDPLPHVEPATGGEDEEAKDGEDLVTELHR